MSIKISKLKKELPHIAVRRAGKKIEFEGDGLKYRVERGAFRNEGELADAIRSRIPVATLNPGIR